MGQEVPTLEDPLQALHDETQALLHLIDAVQHGYEGRGGQFRLVPAARSLQDLLDDLKAAGY